MSIKRASLETLDYWKKSVNRKPLLVRGARQVGKTTLVRAFAQRFESYVELNLEKEEDKKLFEIDDISELFNAILLLKRVTENDQSFLLFIDEIQESPKAIQKLRYFYEEKPNIYVVAAGSLLEFALDKVPSFPVGRIEYLYLHPLNYQEYLGAVGEEGTLEVLNQLPIPEYAHDILLKSFHQYVILGGMPEIVNDFRDHNNFSKLKRIYNQLWTAYKDDVEKYAKSKSEGKVMRHVIDAAPKEQDRIKMEGFGSSNYRSREVGEALRSLDLARIVRLIYPTNSTEPPSNTDLKKRPRLQFLDTGLLNHALFLQGEMIGMKDMSDFHRGKIIQHIVNQELISIHEEVDYKPHFWVREEFDRNSEVDLIYQIGSKLIPIEIKSGKQGRLRSLHQFVERTNHPYAIRMYAGKFSIESHTTPGGKPYLLMNLPYYLGTKIPEYAKYFMSKHTL